MYIISAITIIIFHVQGPLLSHLYETCFDVYVFGLFKSLHPSPAAKEIL